MEYRRVKGGGGVAYATFFSGRQAWNALPEKTFRRNYINLNPFKRKLKTSSAWIVNIFSANHHVVLYSLGLFNYYANTHCLFYFKKWHS